MENWQQHFQEHNRLSHMGNVMLYRQCSLYDLYPYFQSSSTNKLCNEMFAHCQRLLPLISLEKLSFLDENKEILNIGVSFTIKNAKFVYDDLLILKNIELIINELYGLEAKKMLLQISFDSVDVDGVTETEWEVVDYYLNDCNSRLQNALAIKEFKDDFIQAYQQFYLEEAKKITKSINIPFDNNIIKIR